MVPNTLEPRSPFKIREPGFPAILARQVAVVTSVPPEEHKNDKANRPRERRGGHQRWK